MRPNFGAFAPSLLSLFGRRRWFLGRDINQLAPNYTVGDETSRHALGDFDYVKRAVLYPAVHMPPCDNPSGIVPPKGNDCSKPIQVSHDNISGASNRML